MILVIYLVLLVIDSPAINAMHGKELTIKKRPMLIILIVHS
jgi:hypothetical protein